jgi:hypothetical protein
VLASGEAIYEHDVVSWIRPDVARIDEPFTGPERGILDGFLDWHRSTLLWKCAGLSDRKCPGSGACLELRCECLPTGALGRSRRLRGRIFFALVLSRQSFGQRLYGAFEFGQVVVDGAQRMA